MLGKKKFSYLKDHFRHIIFYSIPKPILFIVRKRLNLASLNFFLISFLFFSIL